MKKIEYVLTDDKVSGSYSGDGYNYTKGFLYFTPNSSVSYYGMMVYYNSFNTNNLLSSLYDADQEKTISLTTFNSLYKSFNDVSRGSSYTFSSSIYTLPMDIISSLSTITSTAAKSMEYSFEKPKPAESSSDDADK